MEFGHFGGFAASEVIAIDVGECDYRAALQDGKPGIELGLPASGQPYVFREDSSSNNCRLLGFYKGHFGVQVFGKQMFSEEALSQHPAFG